MADFPRDFYIGHPDDDEDTFENTMTDILGDDDVDRLHNYLKIYGDHRPYPGFLDMCLRVRATKCALHLIEGKLPHGPPILAADHCEPKPRVPVLYRALHHMCDPYVFRLLLTDCKAANQVHRPYAGLFLLHWLLNRLSTDPPLSEWAPERPLSTLIDSLFVPEVKSKLECARMLAQHTPSLDQIALGFILNEEIPHLAALLLTAPFTSGDFETLKSYTSIASRAIHGQSITPATSCADALLYIFEKDGDELTSKFNNTQEESARASEGDQSVVNCLIRKMGINFARMLSSTSSQMTNSTMENEIICPEDEGNDTFKLLQANLTHANDDVVDQHFKSHDAHQLNPTYTRLLHSVLGSIVKYDYLSKWAPGQSLVKLILLLFLQHELRPTLECTQLICKRIDLVNEVARKLIQQGELIQLAGLLLVAREKAMKPFDSGDTIKEETIMEYVSQVFHGKPVSAATVGAAGLFEIFDKAGDALAEYWSIHKDDEHEHEPKGVIVEVAARIQRSGIQVLPTDVDLTDIIYSASSSHPEMLKSICERLGIKADNTSKKTWKSPFPSVQGVKERCQPPVPVSGWPYTRVATESKLGSRAFSTWSGSANQVSRLWMMKHSCTSPCPSRMVRNLAYMAMKLKRGVVRLVK